MALYAIANVEPELEASVWVADSAQVIGHVRLQAHASVWFGAVIRGDQPEPIQIGAGSNIQDGCVLHADAGVPLTIGRDVTVGHHAVLHGCEVGDGALIGIGAVVLNRARIGRQCLVGAGALVTEGKSFPDGSLIIGRPAVAQRPLTDAEKAGLQRSAEHYKAHAAEMARTLRRID